MEFTFLKKLAGNEKTPTTSPENSNDFVDYAPIHDQTDDKDQESSKKLLILKRRIDQKTTQERMRLIEKGVTSVAPLTDTQKIAQELDNIQSKEQPQENERSENAAIEIHAASERDLIAQVQDHYNTKIDRAKIEEKLRTRAIPEEKIPALAQTIIERMASKLVNKFKKERMQDLMTHGFSQNNASAYIDWRLNTYTRNNPIFLMHVDGDDTLVAGSFVNADALGQFNAMEKEYEGKIDTAKILTSEEIERLQKELGKIAREYNTREEAK